MLSRHLNNNDTHPKNICQPTFLLAVLLAVCYNYLKSFKGGNYYQTDSIERNSHRSPGKSKGIRLVGISYRSYRGFPVSVHFPYAAGSALNFSSWSTDADHWYGPFLAGS